MEEVETIEKTRKRKLKKGFLYLLFVVSFVAFVVFLYCNNLIALKGNTLFFNRDFIKYFIFAFLMIALYKITKAIINE